MIHKLTKFQREVLDVLKPQFKNMEYGSELNFDDELKITFTTKRGSVILTIFPNEDILYTLNRNSGGYEVEFFRLKFIDRLINIIQQG